MSEARERALWLAPAAALALAVLGFAPFHRFAPAGLVGPPLDSALLVLTCALAALHRPWGGGALGLGTLALVPAFERAGVVPAAWIAAAGAVAAEAIRRGLERRREAPLPERRRGVRVAAQASLCGLGAFAAGAVWLALRGGAPETGSAGTAFAALVAGLAHVVPAAAFEALTRRRLREERAGRILPALAPLAFDLPGFAIGALAITVARRADWALASGWIAVATLLAFEAARQELAAAAAGRRLAESERLSRAGGALAVGAPELERIARSIHDECRGILPFAWFQLELEVPDLGRRSFSAAEGGALAEGEPAPPPVPPALPGFHRREAWRLVERPLEADGERLATIRLWCDPRRLESRSESLLDGLLPSMAASVRSALLDRQARVDRLTGAATRRAFEERLYAGFSACRDEARSLALVVGDLDHFKRINDTYGHAAGDRALVAAARVLLGPSRGRELCARWGGEEFVLLLEDTNGETALEIAERARRRIESLELEFDGERTGLSMSFGVAAFPELAARTGDELLALADTALYAAKRLGRNLALLDLGRGRMRTGSGRLIEIDESISPPDAPVFFA